MTIEEQAKLIMRKYPATRYKTSTFMKEWMREFIGVDFYITFSQFDEFWKSEATLERIRRKLLKEEEFKLPPEIDQGRYNKASEMQEIYHREVEGQIKKDDWFQKSLKGQEKQDYNTIFKT